MKVLSAVLALFVSLLIVSNLSAADEKKKAEGKRPEHPIMQRVQAMLKGLDLTDEQKTQVKDLMKEFGPKFKDEMKKMEGILTAEQKKAREEAVKAAKEAGKKGKEVWEAAKAAVTLTDEQKAKLAEGRKAAEALQKEFHEKLMSILTPEQKEKLKKGHEKKGPGAKKEKSPEQK